MRGMVSYDTMETIRNTNEWLGASARAMASYPAFAMIPHPMFKLLSAWGRVTERSFARMVIKPDWNIPPLVGEEGQDHLVYVEPVLTQPFGRLLQFRVARREPMARRVLLIAPMSGHYATLLRSTVKSLLPHCDVWVTDWRNARDIPVSEGKFDVEDYTKYVIDYIRHLGPDLHVMAVCQPAPLALAATAVLAETDPAAQPRTLTLIGGPIDPDAAATDVTDFGNRVTMGQLDAMFIQQVGFKYRGAGRMVYPGLAQLGSFISMNAESHTKAFVNQIFAEARGEASENDRHNKFYNEYLSVMDMTAEFYLSTVERIFQTGEIAKNEFTVDGRLADMTAIRDVAIMTIEGANDDISAPGQCVAALDLCSNVPPERKAQHLEPNAGHYGIFAGKSWRLNIRPLVLDFMDEHSADAEQPRRKRRPAGQVATDTGPGAPDDDRKLAV
ncbi:polyhydroxyalkanoate depolymerase [Paracoccus sp. Z118]|uniref:polyhydroxyalkanoate depolymerase n=1 Tax=Paracoccus sp. Z118 TaxID=2851017 RepID=UPI001C2C2EE3|nr:polyhydroxyalkanoate depolymerase [Paracoccus sp. Z118]MBV0893363.1 polyhydroxyalkanoate depolymerase [Paracoccus sp. Z118]